MVLLVSGDTTLNLDNMTSMDIMPGGDVREKPEHMLSFSFAGNVRTSILPLKNTKKSCVQLRDYILSQILRHDKGKDSVIIDVSKYDGK